MDEEILKSAKVINQMMDAMIPKVQQHLVSIAAWYDGNLHQHATGSLVRFADHHFLITAAHAIEKFDQARNIYPDIQLVVDNGNANVLVPLYGEYHATTKVRDPERPRLVFRGERDDLWDIALWELHDDTIAQLTNKRFLNRQDISITQDVSDGLYFFAGAPCSWATVDKEARSVTFKWIKYSARIRVNNSDLPHFHERFQIAICCDGDSELPRLVGISGCPIWKLCDFPIPDNWQPDDARIVAIETHTYGDPPTAICGTKWENVVRVLGNRYPELREGFRLSLPGIE